MSDATDLQEEDFLPDTEPYENARGGYYLAKSKHDEKVLRAYRTVVRYTIEAVEAAIKNLVESAKLPANDHIAGPLQRRANELQAALDIIEEHINE